MIQGIRSRPQASMISMPAARISRWWWVPLSTMRARGFMAMLDIISPRLQHIATDFHSVSFSNGRYGSSCSIPHPSDPRRGWFLVVLLQVNLRISGLSEQSPAPLRTSWVMARECWNGRCYQLWWIPWWSRWLPWAAWLGRAKDGRWGPNSASVLFFTMLCKNCNCMWL